MIVLGIIDSKPSTAAVLADGKILSAVSEERLCRMKMATGTPRQAITVAMNDAGITAKDIDLVAICQYALAFHPEPQPWDGWFQSRTANHGRFVGVSAGLAPLVGRMPVARDIHHQLKRFLTRERLHKLPALLRNEYGIEAPVRFYDHHYCHATAAYFTSNFDSALVVTLDGGGDGRSASVYEAEGGRLRAVASVDSYHSLGNFYSYITALCGFKAELHEGKITGLAAAGEPHYLDNLRKFIRYEEPGKIRYTIPMYHRSALERLTDHLPANFDRADLAASVQSLLEEIGAAFVQHWLRQTGKRQIATAGGVFSNVKFNQRVHELDEVDRFFVHPAMGDDGLAVGAAFAAFAELPGSDPSRLIQRLPNVYLGPDYSDQVIGQAVARAGFESHYFTDIHQKIAELLAQGHVVARFAGRMEYGPRALGHRSIMFQTTDPAVNDWLNENLKRTEFMPFAPATLEEYAHRCYEGIEGAEDPARFMTVTFNCTAEMKEMSPGVVHIDGTARPQLIDKHTAPDFHGILSRYHRITGIPSLINTSFNMHGEPIVCTPEDALRSFNDGHLEYLAMGNWLIAHPHKEEADVSGHETVAA